MGFQAWHSKLIGSQLFTSFEVSRNEYELQDRCNNLMKADTPDSYVVKYPQLLDRLQFFWKRGCCHAELKHRTVATTLITT